MFQGFQRNRRDPNASEVGASLPHSLPHDLRRHRLSPRALTTVMGGIAFLAAGMLACASPAAADTTRFDVPAMDRGAAVLDASPQAPKAAPSKPAPRSAPRPSKSAAQPTPTSSSRPKPAVPTRAAAPRAWGWGCADARVYWRLHGNKRFAFICTGNSGARPQAFTCPTACSDGPSWTVQINDPCPVAYMNESANSWTWDTYNGGLGWYSYEVQQRQNLPWSVQHAHGLDLFGFSC